MAKRVVSYCLYGTNPLYIQGALRNVKLVPSIYPGWTPRVYVSQEIGPSDIDSLVECGAEVIRKERKGPIDGMFWRFLPVGDSSIEAVIIRDTDSRPTYREAAAVEQWLASGKTLHLMRDHPEHRVAIMGGMWGCRGGAVPDMQALIERWGVWARKGQDQVFLREVVYPRFERDLLVHSELYSFGDELCLPFPVPRSRGEYVGAVIHPDRDTLTEEQIEQNERLFQGLVFEKCPRARPRPWIKSLIRTKQWFRSLLPKRGGA